MFFTQYQFKPEGSPAGRNGVHRIFTWHQAKAGVGTTSSRTGLVYGWKKNRIWGKIWSESGNPEVEVYGNACKSERSVPWPRHTATRVSKAMDWMYKSVPKLFMWACMYVHVCAVYTMDNIIYFIGFRTHMSLKPRPVLDNHLNNGDIDDDGRKSKCLEPP